MSGDRGLPDPFPRPDHRDGRQRKRRVARRLEAEVSALVAQARGQHTAREQETLARPQDRLVGEVDDDLCVGDR